MFFNVEPAGPIVPVKGSAPAVIPQPQHRADTATKGNTSHLPDHSDRNTVYVPIVEREIVHIVERAIAEPRNLRPFILATAFVLAVAFCALGLLAGFAGQSIPPIPGGQ